MKVNDRTKGGSSKILAPPSAPLWGYETTNNKKASLGNSLV